MADVNWSTYRCRICLMLALAVASVVSALLAWLLLRAGVPVAGCVILFLVIWAGLGTVVDGHCRRHATERSDHGHGAAHAAAQHDQDEHVERGAATEVAPVAEADGRDVMVVESASADEGRRPRALAAPRGGKADDLKLIKGIGPKLEKLCNELGFWHLDQIAAWTDEEVAWVDSNLEGFRGRVTRDQWVAQARVLAAGGETEFSKRVDDGDVPSSQ